MIEVLPKRNVRDWLQSFDDLNFTAMVADGTLQMAYVTYSDRRDLR